MLCCVHGAGGFFLAPKNTGLDAKEGHVFLAALDDIAGKTAEDRPYEQKECRDVEEEGEIRKDVGNLTQDGKDHAQKQKNDLN